MPRLAVALLLLVTACRSGTKEVRELHVLRVGYLSNLTHAPALVGLQAGLFQQALGPGVTVEALAFPAGPQLIEALFARELDMAYVGPNPAINGFQRSRGEALRVVAGSTSGGASLVVRREIESPADLASATLSSPALGNTQDVALRIWLRDEGLKTTEQGGTVRIRPAPPSDILTLFERGDLAGAWVPEPWASRLVIEGGGKVLVDERTLWPDGDFPTTVVIASGEFVRQQPDLVRRFLVGHGKAVAMLEEQPERARALAGILLYEKLKVELPPAVVKRAYEHLRFTLDPMEPELHRVAEEAYALGFIESAEIEGLVDRSFLPPPAVGPPANGTAPSAPAAPAPP